MTQKLVAYFSATGVTRNIAKQLAQAAGADLFEIKPIHPYTNADLDWRDTRSRSSLEMKDPHSRPEIAEGLGNIADYDTIFLGFPIWWYTAPTIIHTFLESYDFSGKTILPFATSGGSGFGKTVSVLKPLCDKSVLWLSGRILNRTSAQELSDFAAQA